MIREISPKYVKHKDNSFSNILQNREKNMYMWKKINDLPIVTWPVTAGFTIEVNSLLQIQCQSVLLQMILYIFQYQYLSFITYNKGIG